VVKSSGRAAERLHGDDDDDDDDEQIAFNVAYNQSCDREDT